MQRKDVHILWDAEKGSRLADFKSKNSVITFKAALLVGKIFQNETELMNINYGKD